ncbi:glycosyl hydrolase family 10 [Chitinophaga skermanii]|uniref:Glycosyl hydrolase family 10 n=1 Tax=Chitinophaga skermanii TaxID=331697 RepID=A0A327R263_9BACT|nr:alpha amylase family protein [Chitinophaga skermanii]RAJ10939.1 glycosyl hydrolase family 10 [Chitinophaga skermanii]
MKMNGRLLCQLLICCFFASMAQAQTRRNILWFDATANFKRFSYEDSIKNILDKCQQAGVTDVVIDVKPITGEVLYKSKIAPQMLDWNGDKRAADFDMLQVFINEAHKRNMVAHASMNVFVAGHNHFDRGVVYTSHPEWQSLNYTDSGLVPISKIKTKYSAMLNPANPEVRAYELSIVKEIVDMYPTLDGIILDRGRYDGIQADFSPLSQQLFEKYIGKKVANFPSDIYTYKGKQREPGVLYKEWLEWRASVIYKFFADARKVAKKANKKIIFGDYTGAWYSTYYEVGVNWASKKYDPSKDYNWATKKYKQYGYAELLDLFTTGCYFFEVAKSEVNKGDAKAARTEAGMETAKSPLYTVEGSAELSKDLVKGAVPVYAGLYVDQYAKDKNQFIKAMKMCRAKSDGVMVFDVVHIINNGWWDALTEGLKGNL